MVPKRIRKKESLFAGVAAPRLLRDNLRRNATDADRSREWRDAASEAADGWGATPFMTRGGHQNGATKWLAAWKQNRFQSKGKLIGGYVNFLSAITSASLNPTTVPDGVSKTGRLIRAG